MQTYDSLALLLALLAARGGRHVHADITQGLASRAVDELLHIVASTMLAVANFPVGIIADFLTPAEG